DVNAYYDELKRNGTNITTEIGDRDYDIRDFSVTDINGYILVFGQDID
ncbi:MAG: bleomycin resistance protein, partial [Gammaproteobacteria bacterium]|nr:bleomycin resistance protein [Gammaproteobacteria bacterium]